MRLSRGHEGVDDGNGEKRDSHRRLLDGVDLGRGGNQEAEREDRGENPARGGGSRAVKVGGR